MYVLAALSTKASTAEQSTSPDMSLIQSFEVLLALHMESDAVELLKKNREAVIDDSLSGSDMLFVMISLQVFGPGDTSSLSPLTPTKVMLFFLTGIGLILGRPASVWKRHSSLSLSKKAHFAIPIASLTRWLFQLCATVCCGVVGIFSMYFHLHKSALRRKFKSMARAIHCWLASLVFSCLSLTYSVPRSLSGEIVF